MRTREFRLKTVLRARARELDGARGRLAGQLREREREIRDQAELLAQLEQTARTLHARLALGSPASILRAASGAMDAARQGAQAAGQRATACEASIAEARVAVIAAKRRLRGLEILEQRFFDQEQRKYAKQQQFQLDELATRSRREIYS